MKTLYGDLTDGNVEAARNKYKTKRVETFRTDDGETMIYLSGDPFVYLKDFNELKEKYNL